MKKTVIIMIGVIYVVAIALVAFLGINYKTFDPVYYIKDIEIIGDGVEIQPDGTKKAIVYLDSNNTATYTIKCHYATTEDEAGTGEIVWRDANTEKLAFSIDTQTTCATVSESGVVTFTKFGAVKVRVLPTDNSDCYDEIYIVAKYR
ncbi:MAG: hypothetical protein J6Q69_05105 [Clostridia bacterium]|nr:hypothetical protein [Clostridia bacterium]